MKNMKAITKWLLGAAMAGAFLLATPNKAQAQVAIGVEIAPPVAVYAPAGYYGWRRREYYEHERWERRERWERFHDRYGWHYRYY